MDSEKRNCQNCKKDFVVESDDFIFYKKISVPAPTWCPFCRFVRRLTFINERSLYKRNCENCNLSVVTMYHPNTTLPVWCTKCHSSDEREALDYGCDYDFSENFFVQFKNLKYRVPHPSIDQNEKNGAGCEYSNFCYSSKDVYLSFNVAGSENIKYSKYVLRDNKNCMDSYITQENDRGYELVQSRRNYNSTFLVESNQCVESHFLYDCSNCVDCCLSTNLRNKSFVFKNVQLSREEYKIAVDQLKLGTYSGQQEAKKIFGEISRNAIHKYAQIKSCVNTQGDFIENSKDIAYSYGLVNAESMKYVFIDVSKAKDSYDVFFAGRVEQCYEIDYGGRGASRVTFSFSCGAGSQNVAYSDYCKNCKDCFGCVGLKNKQYCILNQQYSKEDYFTIVEKIKKHMCDMPYIDKIGRVYKFGEYFPTEISPFAYNETIAFEENPLTKEEITAQGYAWREMETKNHNATLKTSEIPESIKDINEGICNQIIECPNKGNPATQCTSAFKILVDELSFYKLMNLPIPRYCPNCRHHERLKWKNPFRFYKRVCMCSFENHTHKGKCEVEFETSYSPDRPEIIYCEKCYQQEVV